MLILQDVGPLRSMYARCMEAMLLNDCEPEEDVNINNGNINTDMCTNSVLQAIIQRYVSFHTS